MVAAFDASWRLGTADWKIDESFDGALAWEAVHHGRWGLEDGHPIAVRLLFGAGQTLLGQNRVGIRGAAALASLGAVALLFVLGRMLAGWWVGFAAAAVWAVVPRAITLGHTTVGVLRIDRFGYLEPFMVVFVLGAMVTGWRWVERGTARDAVRTGLLIGAAVAFKPTAIVVVLPVVACGWFHQRRTGPVLLHAGLMGALAVIVLVVSYAPVGSNAFVQMRNLYDFQSAHARQGHLLVVDGRLQFRQPWWSHFAYQLRGMGIPACGALVVGMVTAWVVRRRSLEVAFVTAVWLTLLLTHVLTRVALPHYYLLWAPITVLLGALGLVELVDQRRGHAAPLAALGAAGLTALAVVGAVATARTATLPVGAYGKMARVLAAEHVTPARALYIGESVDRYLPRTVAFPVGFGDETQRVDLIVIDPRDAPSAGAGKVPELRARARAWGLTEHHVGRLELWYAPPR
ncbi:MAG: hypothetical protein JWN46_783 [Acidimicrobiales bacterium]|nr:hypothetical protein [Acidimicrobiales bacterium]